LAGIYIHIPYCSKACTYCDFYFSTNFASKERFLDCLVKEIVLQKGKLKGSIIDTIYFGGGTPSVLTKSELTQVMTALSQNFSIVTNAEITLEANPENLTEQYLKELKEVGINRLSIGLQSFKPSELIEMNRSHTVAENNSVIKNALRMGFNNISIDLIYGTPWANEQEWDELLDHVLTLDVQHISCYQLTVEEKTLLHHKIKSGKVAELNDELTEKQFLILISKLKKAGFVHYEISNFGKPGYFSKHNTSYWKDIPYLGLGPSAHSYIDNSRFYNIANIHAYCKDIEIEKVPNTEEKLEPKDIYNDLVLTGLRTVFGVDIRRIEKKLDQSFVNFFQRKAQPYLEKGVMNCENYVYTLKEESFLFADSISSDLFYI